LSNIHLYTKYSYYKITKKFLILGTVATLKRLAARQELKLADAANYTEKPYVGETLYPFVESWAPSASMTSRKRKAEESDDDTPKGIFIPTPSASNKKFTQNNHWCETIFNVKNFKDLLPEQMQNSDWTSKAKNLSSLALASNTWHKYFAAFTKFQTYLNSTNQSLSWPIKSQVLNGFVIWCLNRKNIQPQSVKAYIFGISKIQQFLGYEKIPFAKTITETLLNGWKNAYVPSKPHRKGKMTIKILKKILHLAKKTFNNFDFQTIWTACCLAFFTSCRMGEILAPKTNSFDENSTLLWRDITFKKSKLKIKIKMSKASNEPEYIYLFRIPHKKLCPVRALGKLKKLQILENIFDYDQPIFRFSTGQNLTKSFLNKWLSKNFTNIASHSFRNAIPTLLAKHPDITNDQHIQAWGRWKSNAFLTYQRSSSSQKKWIFHKIIDFLFS
jgi:integrase